MSVLSDSSDPEATANILGRSALVAEIRELSQRARHKFDVPEAFLFLADLLIGLCEIVTDDSDPRPILERFDVELDITEEQLESLAAGVEELPTAIEDLPRWMRHLKPATAQRFLERFLGAAVYARLERAFQKDGALVILALRRGLRYAMPLATAVDNCLRPLSTEQLAEIPGFPVSEVPKTMLEILVEFDRVAQRALGSGLPIEDLPVRPAELELLAGDLEELIDSYGADISERSARIIRELSEDLERKVRGARDALDHSADPISQAANSLVELIDQLLRRAFTDDEVLIWIRENYPARESRLTYTPAGKSVLRPTKRGQALCFTFAGQPIGENTLLEEAVAAGLVVVRHELEGLKHGEGGNEHDRRRLLDGLAAVESFLVVACRISWLSADDQVLEGLRARIGSKAA